MRGAELYRDSVPQSEDFSYMSYAFYKREFNSKAAYAPFLR